MLNSTRKIVLDTINQYLKKDIERHVKKEIRTMYSKLEAFKGVNFTQWANDAIDVLITIPKFQLNDNLISIIIAQVGGIK